MTWIVMSATELTESNANRNRCYERNVVGIATEAEAEAIAKERNKTERAAGHTNVLWYPCPDLNAMMEMLK